MRGLDCFQSVQDVSRWEGRTRGCHRWGLCTWRVLEAAPDSQAANMAKGPMQIAAALPMCPSRTKGIRRLRLPPAWVLMCGSS